MRLLLQRPLLSCSNSGGRSYLPLIPWLDLKAAAIEEADLYDRLKNCTDEQLDALLHGRSSRDRKQKDDWQRTVPY